jgi:hypothetical protein
MEFHLQNPSPKSFDQLFRLKFLKLAYNYGWILRVKFLQIIHKQFVFNVTKHKDIVLANKMRNRMLTELYTSHNCIRLYIDLIKRISADHCINLIVLSWNHQIHRPSCLIHCFGLSCLNVLLY